MISASVSNIIIHLFSSCNLFSFFSCLLPSLFVVWISPRLKKFWLWGTKTALKRCAGQRTKKKKGQQTPPHTPTEKQVRQEKKDKEIRRDTIQKDNNQKGMHLPWKRRKKTSVSILFLRRQNRSNHPPSIPFQLDWEQWVGQQRALGQKGMVYS